MLRLRRGDVDEEDALGDPALLFALGFLRIGTVRGQNPCPAFAKLFKVLNLIGLGPAARSVPELTPSKWISMERGWKTVRRPSARTRNARSASSA